jgi:hypothetical protein
VGGTKGEAEEGIAPRSNHPFVFNFAYCSGVRFSQLFARVILSEIGLDMKPLRMSIPALFLPLNLALTLPSILLSNVFGIRETAETCCSSTNHNQNLLRTFSVYLRGRSIQMSGK